jgi:hypothetical protein
MIIYIEDTKITIQEAIAKTTTFLAKTLLDLGIVTPIQYKYGYKTELYVLTKEDAVKICNQLQTLKNLVDCTDEIDELIKKLEL